MLRQGRFAALLVAFAALALLFSACTIVGSDAKVQMVPDPPAGTNSFVTSGFDDDYAQVAFTRGFTFTFFGTTYNSVYINTNGGVTFGAGTTVYHPQLSDMVLPGIAILWADLDAGLSNPANANGIDYQQFDDRFEITYTDLADHNDDTLLNTMKLTLYADGTISMHYDTQDSSTYVLLGVFDGNGGYTSAALQSTYNAYSAGHGIYVFDANDAGGTAPTQNQLDGMTLTFNP
ncbi:MAG: hypothetical protein P8Z81_08365 [Deinococcales bacterium]